MKKNRFIAMLLAVTMMVIGTFSTASAAEQAEITSLVVKLINGLTAVEQTAVISRNGGVETSSIPALRLHVVSVPTADLPPILGLYQSDPQVQSVELNKTRKAEGIPVDTNYGLQWALSKIGWESAFGNIAPSGSAKLAILDTGVDASHPDLGINVISGTSILNGTNGLSDPNGHGTSLAGIIAAITDNGQGIAGISYAGVKIMPVTVLNENGVGQDSDIIAGIIWAVDNGADVILMGFSNPDFSQNLQDAIDYAWLNGAVIIAAAGNDGVSTHTFPAGNRGVVGVSATDQFDMLYAGSNYGQHIFLAAPGADIYTTGLDNSYISISGTSASSAVVASVAAFMKAVDPALTNGVIVNRLASSADAVGTMDDPNNPVMFGNGRINMANALADIGTDEIQPAGASPVGNGGPYVGPYVAACRPALELSINSGLPGDVVIASGSLHGNKKIITIEFAGAAVTTLPEICSTGTGGSFTCSFTVPTGTTGNKTVTSSSKQASAAVTFNLMPTMLDQTIYVDSPVPADAPYGSTFNVAAHADSELPVSITASGSCSATGTDSPVSVSMTSASGACVVELSQSGNTNFKAATKVTGSTNAKTRPITITADAVGKSLGVIDPALTYQITSGSLANNDTLSGALVRSAGEDVGTYAILQGTLAASNKYSVTYVGANLTIGKGTATLALGDLTPTYDGTPKAATVATSPAGLTGVAVTYDGLATAPTNFGSYAVVATLTNDNYQAANATGTLVIGKGTATLTLSDLTPTYDGTPKAATVATSPASLTGVAVTYDGLATAPTNAGSYAVVATLTNDNYQAANATGTLVISTLPVTITWANPADINNMTPLSSTQLNAVASVPGTFKYTPDSGALLGVGTKTLSVIFTPTDTNYSTVPATVTINVIPVPPCVEPSYLTVPTNNTSGSLSFYWGSSSNCSGATFVLEQSADNTTFTPVYSGTSRSNVIIPVIANGIYTYRVKATKSGYADSGFKTGSNTCNVALKCGVPSSLTVPASNSTGSMTLYWGPSDVSGVSYILQQSTDGINFNTIYSGTSKSMTVTMTANGTYSYRVKAIKADTNYADSNYTATSTCNVFLKCGTPSYLTVPATNTTGTINVTWGTSDVSGVTYVLEQSSNGVDYTAVYSGTSLYANITVSTNGTYIYRVMAIKAGTNYANSDYTTTSTCNVFLKCGTPSYLTAQATNTTGTINVTWGTSDVSGVTYVLQQSSNGVDYTTVYSGTSLYKNNITMAASGTYLYRVKAIKAGYADSDDTTTSTCNVALKCGTPSYLTVPATNTTGTINVTWGTSEVSGVTYVLEQSSNGVDYTTVYSGTSLYKNNITIAASGTYIYRVKAIKAGYADSDYATSNCSVTLSCGVPTLLTVPATNTTGTINVSWAAPLNYISGVTYVLEKSSNGIDYTVVYTGTSLYKNNITMATNGTYIYRVKAIKSGYADSDYATSNCSVTLSCGAPTLLTVPATNTTGIVYVTWGASNVSGVTYTLEQSSDNGQNYTPVYSGTSLYKSNTVPNGTYTYRVKATKTGYVSSDYTYSAVSCTVTK